MQEIRISGEYIKLDQLLKISDVVGTGGHAKYLIQNGDVKVNGVTEYQRGKKIKAGDIVEVEGITFKVVCQ
ncbi:MAG: RNA-binding S4 domain-containing protein [Bacillota bacterium]